MNRWNSCVLNNIKANVIIEIIVGEFEFDHGLYIECEIEHEIGEFWELDLEIRHTKMTRL